MKKTLLALALLGTFAGAASAQTNVTLYGLIDTGVTVFDNGEDRTYGLSSGLGAATRFGIRGTEDLGGGLSAQFLLEQGFNSDDGGFANSARQFSRLSYVGLKGGFGTFRMGRQDTAMKDALGRIDPFGAAGLNNAHDYLLGGIDQRRGNQLTYFTPNLGGFQGGVYYNFGEQPDSVSTENIYGARVGYDNGPIFVQLVYERLNDAAGPGNNQKDTLLGGAYNFGVVSLHAAYANRSIDAGDDIRSGMIGVSSSLGQGKIMADYITVDNRDTNNADSKVFGIGYNYDMSKRTSLIVRYVHVKNDSGTQLDVAGGDFAVAGAGETGKVLSLGIQHRF